jgi:hypothetical protein
MLKELIWEKWWTRTGGKTDPAGSFEFRGFFGDYSVRVACGDRQWTGHLRLDRSSGGGEAVIDLSALP